MDNSKLRKYKKIAHKIVKLEETYRCMSDAELKQQTSLFRQRLSSGEKIESLLVEAYAVSIEADRRVLGLKPYFVQILGGIALFFGNVAEMKTGEGKTLTATMPLYLHGLQGKGNYLITANSYLAWRDAEDVGKVFQWMGLTLGIGVPRDASEDVIDKEQVYNSDIIYTTHSALGFDYLFTNLTTEMNEQYVDTFNFVLIDEIDAILLDMAQTPLIVSGAPKVQSNLFRNSDWFIKSINEQEDFQISEDKKSVWFTQSGIEKAQNFFGVDAILSEKWEDLYRHLVIALQANHILEKDRAYVVDKDEVFLLDEANGRKLTGTKLQAGMHQAIEAKEGVTITDETKSMGTITYQNLFKMFRVLSGMTGTAKTDAEEFITTYNVDVVVIPTNQPMIREDYLDEVYVSNKAKTLNSLRKVKEALGSGRPILIETGSVTMSNLYSMILLKNKIPHNLLNATSVAKESWIVSEAGKKNAVTVATSMAGRGTDIKLDEDAKESGGLLVVGTERMTSKRIDNQLRGRSGRQGDPGESIFFVSMEDKIVIESAPKWVSKMRKKLSAKLDQLEIASENEQPLTKRRYREIIDRAQNNRKNQEVEGRKNVLEYDEIISIQREKVYSTRNEIMSADSARLDEIIEQSITNSIEAFVSDKDNFSENNLSTFIFNNIDYNLELDDYGITSNFSKHEVRQLLTKTISKKIEIIHQLIPNDFQRAYFKRVIILKAIDSMWIDQADNLQQLKTVVNSRSWGQHRPIYEYQVEARRSFFEMKNEIWLNILRNYLLSDLLYNSDGSIELDFP